MIVQELVLPPLFFHENAKIFHEYKKFLFFRVKPNKGKLTSTFVAAALKKAIRDDTMSRSSADVSSSSKSQLSLSSSSVSDDSSIIVSKDSADLATDVEVSKGSEDRQERLSSGSTVTDMTLSAAATLSDSSSSWSRSTTKNGSGPRSKTEVAATSGDDSSKPKTDDPDDLTSAPQPQTDISSSKDDDDISSDSFELCKSLWFHCQILIWFYLVLRRCYVKWIHFIKSGRGFYSLLRSSACLARYPVAVYCYLSMKRMAAPAFQLLKTTTRWQVNCMG